MRGFVKQHVPGASRLTSRKDPAPPPAAPASADAGASAQPQPPQSAASTASSSSRRSRLAPASLAAVNSMKPQQMGPSAAAADPASLLLGPLSASSLTASSSSSSKPATPTTPATFLLNHHNHHSQHHQHHRSSASTSASQPSTPAANGGSTIRPVASFDADNSNGGGAPQPPTSGVSDTSSDAPSVTTKNSAFSSSVNSYASVVSSSAVSNGEGEDKTQTAVYGNGAARLSRSSRSDEPPGSSGGGGERSSARGFDDDGVGHDGVGELHLGDIDAPPMRDGAGVLTPNGAVGGMNGFRSTVGGQLGVNGSGGGGGGGGKLSTSSSSTAILAPPTLNTSTSALTTTAPSSATPTQQASAGAWDSSIGKAGLGKTGRVINKLVSDNDALRREVHIERLRADEARSAARLLEDKTERLVADYESRLLEASVTKTLLARKERQVETLTATVEAEKRRARDAAEREKGWRDQMEAHRAEAQRGVDQAREHAALMEGRYHAIAAHWRERGDEVGGAVRRLRAEMDVLAGERERDDDKIATLRELCEQQDSNVSELARQKDDIALQFERYKLEQERLLHDIKRLAREREDEQDRQLDEARNVLGELRWALNVKKNVRGAE